MTEIGQRGCPLPKILVAITTLIVLSLLTIRLLTGAGTTASSYQTWWMVRIGITLLIIPSSPIKLSMESYTAITCFCLPVSFLCSNLELLPFPRWLWGELFWSSLQLEILYLCQKWNPLLERWYYAITFTLLTAPVFFSLLWAEIWHKDIPGVGIILPITTGDSWSSGPYLFAIFWLAYPILLLILTHRNFFSGNLPDKL